MLVIFILNTHGLFLSKIKKLLQLLILFTKFQMNEKKYGCERKKYGR